MVVHAGAEKGQLPARVGVPLGELGDVGEDLLFRKRGLELELASQADCVRQVVEELVDTANADRPEHLLPVGVG